MGALPNALNMSRFRVCAEVWNDTLMKVSSRCLWRSYKETWQCVLFCFWLCEFAPCSLRCPLDTFWSVHCDVNLPNKSWVSTWELQSDVHHGAKLQSAWIEEGRGSSSLARPNTFQEECVISCQFANASVKLNLLDSQFFPVRQVSEICNSAVGSVPGS